MLFLLFCDLFVYCFPFLWLFTGFLFACLTLAPKTPLSFDIYIYFNVRQSRVLNAFWVITDGHAKVAKTKRWMDMGCEWDLRLELGWNGMGYRCEVMIVVVPLARLDERVPWAMFAVPWNATVTNKVELIISHVVIVAVNKCQKPNQLYIYVPLALSLSLSGSALKVSIWEIALANDK